MRKFYLGLVAILGICLTSSCRNELEDDMRNVNSEQKETPKGEFISFPSGGENTLPIQLGFGGKEKDNFRSFILTGHRKISPMKRFMTLDANDAENFNLSLLYINKRTTKYSKYYHTYINPNSDKKNNHKLVTDLSKVNKAVDSYCLVKDNGTAIEALFRTPKSDPITKEDMGEVSFAFGGEYSEDDEALVYNHANDNLQVILGHKANQGFDAFMNKGRDLPVMTESFDEYPNETVRLSPRGYLLGVDLRFIRDYISNTHFSDTNEILDLNLKINKIKVSTDVLVFGAKYKPRYHTKINDKWYTRNLPTNAYQVANG